MFERRDDPDHGHRHLHRHRHGPSHNQGHDREVNNPFPKDEDLTYRGPADHDQHALTFEAMHRIGVSVGELWLYYLSMGGNVDEYELDAYLHGLIRVPALDRDMISQSVNEMIDDICRGPRAPYSASRNSTIPEGDAVFPGIATDTGTTPREPLLSVVYSSAATQSFTDADLAGLLTKSRLTNQSCHLTGLLLYRRGRFLQVLEGPEATVRDRMAIITADPRHTRLRVLVEETKDERQFPDWTMGYEPISPDMSNEVPGYEQTFTDVEDDADPAGTVLVLRDFIRWFQDRAIPLR